MTKLITLSIIAAGVISCQDTSQPDVTPVETVDNKSISGSIKFTLNRDVNHIGKATMNNVVKEELLNAANRINERLVKSGLPAGKMSFKEN